MSDSSNPLVVLDENGSPAVLNYNVPEPTSYTGRNLIELTYDPGMFKELVPADEESSDPSFVDEEGNFAFDKVIGAVTDQAYTKFPDAVEIVRPEVLEPTTIPELEPDVQPPETDLPIDPELPDVVLRRAVLRSTVPSTSSSYDTGIRGLVIDAEQAQANIEAGKSPVVVKKQSGNLALEYTTIPERPQPGIYLVETCRLSSFLKDYGAGRTVNSFSLLPGEKTKISVKTYKNISTITSDTSSVFDSYTEDTADSFETSIQSENSSTESQEKTKEWSVEAEASGNWGVASASVEAGASGSTNSAREDFAKNVSSASEKHAHSASAERSIEVNTSMEQTTEEGEETAIEREIENINVGRTLNFVFRQLNQEFISLLHLVDVRIGFWNGYTETRKEVPLHEIDDLLEYCVTDPADRATIKEDIYYALQNIWDHEHKPQDFLAERVYTERDGSTREVLVIDAEKQQTYDPDGRDITVDGIILSAKTVVLRTDAVIVEALLGEAPALDDYSESMQLEKVAEKALDNRRKELEADLLQHQIDILKNHDEEGARLYSMMFPVESTDDDES